MEGWIFARGGVTGCVPVRLDVFGLPTPQPAATSVGGSTETRLSAQRCLVTRSFEAFTQLCVESKKSDQSAHKRGSFLNLNQVLQKSQDDHARTRVSPKATELLSSYLLLLASERTPQTGSSSPESFSVI